MDLVFCLLFLCSLRSASQSISRTLSLTGKNATQSKAGLNYHANLAIDGNATTFSMAGSTDMTDVPGWWQVDLERDYQVDNVIITASDHRDTEIYLNEFDIWLVNVQGSKQLCNEYPSKTGFNPSETKSFKCVDLPEPLPTRYIKIERRERAFRAYILILAEVEVKIRTPPDAAASSEVRSASQSNITLVSSTLPLTGKNATQSKAWLHYHANLAIDGNATTFSMAGSTDMTDVPGWWQVDLERDYQVDNINITASDQRDTEIYLNEFDIWLVDVQGSKQLCNEYPSKTGFNPSETKSFKCVDLPEPLPTRYIKIERREGAFRADILILAEVEVKIRTPPDVAASSEVAAR